MQDAGALVAGDGVDDLVEGLEVAVVDLVGGEHGDDDWRLLHRGHALGRALDDVGQGVPVNQVQAVGLGSDRPLGAATPTDPINDRVDFIKSQQRTP